MTDCCYWTISIITPFMGSFHLSYPTKSMTFVLLKFSLCRISVKSLQIHCSSYTESVESYEMLWKAQPWGLTCATKEALLISCHCSKEEKKDLPEKDVSVILQSIPIPFTGLHLIFSPVITTQFVKKVLKHSYKTGNWSKLKSALSFRLAIISTERVPAVFKGTSAKGFAVVGKILTF